MTNNRSIFVAAAVVLASIISGGAGQGSAQETRDAKQLVRSSARNLFALAGLEAQFHYQVHAYEHTLVGSGDYKQSGLGPEKLFRLEMSTQLEDYKATQQLICGKQYLWIRRDLGPKEISLSRVNLRRLRQAIEDAGEPLSLDPSPTWMGIVSLPKLLDTIGNWFVFDPATEDKLGERKVLRMRGRINADLRESLLTGKKGSREQVPDAIELTLGTDAALPLFPYRIEYLKAKSKDEPERLLPLVTLDFHSVKVRSDLDPTDFEYPPGDQEVEDRTRIFLERLGFNVGDDK